MAHEHTTERLTPPITYSIEVSGRLPVGLAAQLDGFAVDAGATTTITGLVTDPAELYGLIGRLEALGLTLLSVQAIGDPE